jgi:hypothetical protein
MQPVTKLSDMGIFPPQRWRLTGRCSWHGPQSLMVDTCELLTDDILAGYVRCEPCLDGGVTRWLPISESRLLREGEK